MTIDELKASFQYGFESFEDSRRIAYETWEYFHNRQYTSNQENLLENRGQPKETFNIIKMFSRMIIGYYGNVINNIRVKPRQYQSIIVSEVLNDLMQYILYDNDFRTEADIVKLDAILSGIMAVQVNVQENGETDFFGRPENDIKISYIPFSELVLDPMSRKADFSDARWKHRFKWITGEVFEKLFGEEKRKEVDENYDFLNIDYSDVSELYTVEAYSTSFSGSYKIQDNYLVVQSIISKDDGYEEIFWTGDTILQKHDLNIDPIVVVRLNESHKAEHYGMFKEVLETQKAINQAVVRIQLLVNTEKVFVESEGAVEDLDKFKDAIERVNSVIPVLSLDGIRFENLSADIVNQYQIIDAALSRIKQILGINDSFLGMAYASDSGRKVKLQQTSTIIALRYLTSKFELFYKKLGLTLLDFIREYYHSYRVLRISDDVNGERWIELNKPLIDQNQEPIMMVVEEKEDEIVLDTVNDQDTDIRFAKVDLIIETNSYNDEDERNQLILETFINGAVGQALATVNPSGFFKIASMNVKNFKSKFSPEIAEILEQTAQMTQPQPQMQDALGYAGQSAYSQSSRGESQMSQQLKLPQNTNEGLL